MGIEDIRRLKEEAGKPKVKKTYTIPKKSAKKIKAEKEEKEARGGDDTELVKWYKSRMKQMTGFCAKCSARTETHIYQYAIYSICHILDKRKSVCPSVATHPGNFIELCPDHHTEFDKKDWDEIEKWGCWPEILDKLVMMEPDVALEERRHLPKQLLDYFEKYNPF